MDQELVDRVRQSLGAMAASLQEITDYLEQLRQQTDEQIADMARRTLAMQAAARVAPVMEAVMTEPRAPLDPRYPLTAGRQPRRDGDSFARKAPQPQGGADGKATDGDDVPSGQR